MFKELRSRIKPKPPKIVTIPPRVRIGHLKTLLNETDYKIIKCSEYQLNQLPLPYDIATLHSQRQAIRDEINLLENEVNG